MTRSSVGSAARSPRTCLALLLAGCVATSASAMDPFRALKFGAEMALEGNWREAKFRWEQAATEEPQDAKLLNNLAVAHEALGDVESARRRYEQAWSLAGGDRSIYDNLRRFRLFWDVAPESDARAAIVPADGGQKLKGKTVEALLQLPVPPRLKLEGHESLLVASFRTDDAELFDVNRELGRFLRAEFRKRTPLRLLEVTPPPAIPEQTVEDLIANHEFWRHLGRNHGAQIVVSGVVIFDRDDASTFRDVDVISPETGQKVRQSRFVEQERFRFEMDVLFFDGTTGELRFRDRLQQDVIFQGTQNDPLAAFYDLSEALAGDVISVVAPRPRQESRLVFKR